MSGEEPGCHRQEVGVKGWGGRAVGVRQEEVHKGFEKRWH